MRSTAMGWQGALAGARTLRRPGTKQTSAPFAAHAVSSHAEEGESRQPAAGALANDRSK